jgi:hypothetical protein
MNRASVVVLGVLCAVLGMPQTASAAGSYGAVVEKGVRGCTRESESRVVICFQSPGVNSRSRSIFLQAWHSTNHYLARWDSGPATLRVRTVVAVQGSRPVGTYVATADLVMPRLACRDDFRFHASDGVVQLRSFVSDCQP